MFRYHTVIMEGGKHMMLYLFSVTLQYNFFLSVVKCKVIRVAGGSSCTSNGWRCHVTDVHPRAAPSTLIPSLLPPPHPHPQEFLEQLLAKWSAPVPHYLITSTATANMQMIVGRRLSVLENRCQFSLKSHLVISDGSVTGSGFLRTDAKMFVPVFVQTTFSIKH